jgi:hypothetical protein
MAKGRPVSAWQQARLDAEAARGLYGGNRYVNGQWVTANGSPVQRAPKPPNPFGKQGSLSKQLDRQLQKEINRAVATKAPKDATLRANVDSTCLADLTFSKKDSVATATFYRGGAIVYDFPMSLDEFLDWVSSDDGIGRYGNANVFD